MTNRPGPTSRPGRRAAPVAVALVVATVVMLAGCAPNTGDLGSVATPPSTAQPSLELPSGEPTPGPSGPRPPSTPGPSGSTTTIRAYFFLGSLTDNAGLVPVLRDIPQTESVGAAAMQALIAGPNEAELAARPAMYTGIPSGTRFLGLQVDAGVATVNLSREFESGGGSTSVLGRLAQVVYTLTQFPTIQTVSFQLDGEPVTVFSGEGVVLDAPVGRANYTDQLPVIFVDRPAWGGVVSTPARIQGVANAYEATFEARILDASRRVLGGITVSATCGTGCWGDFDAFIAYRVTVADWATLRVYEQSAADGTETNVTEYPIWLTP